MAIENPERCAILRTLDLLTDIWALGILRCVFYGQRRYTEIQRELGISTNVLADRLSTLVGSGILQKVAYQDRPLRYEYVPTQKGAELGPAIIALREWGRRNLDWDQELPPLRHSGCGGTIHTPTSCSDCGRAVTLGEIAMPLAPEVKSA